MKAFSVNYKFTQRFPVPAQEAFEWATDYQPTDLALMGEEGTRTIQRITEDTIILIENITHAKGKTRKTKLVRLNPRALSWHNIHIRGPNKYSEFLYEITPEGKGGSKLTFTGLMVLYSKDNLSHQTLKQIASREKHYDSKAWKRLANAMAKDHQIRVKRNP